MANGFAALLSADLKVKQNDWNIDMYIITTGIIYTILSYLEEWLQDNR